MQPHLIRLSCAPGERRVPRGIIVGVMEEEEPVTCVQPWFVGSRLGGLGSTACSQMAKFIWARFAFSANASELGASK